VLPFGNTIAVVTITGAQVIAALENGVSQVNLANPSSSAGRFPQVAGLRFQWAPNRPAGSRIVGVQVDTGASASGVDSAEAYVPIDPAASYGVVTNNFMLTGGDGYSVFTEGTNPIDTGFVLADEVQNYIMTNSPINRGIDGRITQAQWWFPFIPRQEIVPVASQRGN
jgi:5'-nucleotidase